MKQLLKLAAVAWVLCGISNAANAFLMYYQMNVSQTTWVLKAKTDAPGGIASFAADLIGVATAVSDAPRADFGGTLIKGFTLGNGFAANQVFASQNTASAGSIVYGVGNTDVPDATFTLGFATMIGSGIRDAGGYIQVFHGTNAGPYSANINWLQTAEHFGSVFGTVGNQTTVGQVIGPGANLQLVVPSEPSAIALVILSVPALFALRRRLRCRLPSPR